MLNDKNQLVSPATGSWIPITPEEQALANQLSRDRSDRVAEMMVERSGAKQRIAAIARARGEVLADDE
ncbi:MAG: hypothetical protein PHF56_00300 [Desulfuromonadaceae bacterium]|nr:hypothetical protein [Desulfuromonadaceae bacterium]